MTMKAGIIIVYVVSLFCSAHCFTAMFGVSRCSSFSRVSSTVLAATASSDAIANALEMSKKYGPTSKEARLAWESVEEINASDNSVVLKKSLEEECSLTSEEAEQACKDYNEKMDQLAEILKQEVEPLRNIEGLVKQLKGIKLPQPVTTSAGAPPDTKKAIADAKAAVAKFGPDSVEAKLAWETVEEIASSDNSQVSAASLDEECLIELEEACQTLHEFSKLVDSAPRI